MESPARASISIDLRAIVFALILVILGMLAVWRPWTGSAADAKTVSVTGTATVKGTPDLFVFYPSYSFKNADRAAALADLTAKSDVLVARLKELGVPDAKIKTNSSGYDYPTYMLKPDDGSSTYTLQLTVTVDTSDLAQKVQDYLATTSPAGSVSPQASFSDATRKTLEGQAREAATRDARAKADQFAANLGFTVDKVKTVSDSQGFGAIPLMGSVGAVDSSSASSATPSLAVQPGENDLSYSVSVVYTIR